MRCGKLCLVVQTGGHCEKATSTRKSRTVTGGTIEQLAEMIHVYGMYGVVSSDIGTRNISNNIMSSSLILPHSTAWVYHQQSNNANDRLYIWRDTENQPKNTRGQSSVNASTKALVL
jgi:hypothetical protein